MYTEQVWKTRLLSALLAAVMLVGMMPTALADGLSLNESSLTLTEGEQSRLEIVGETSLPYSWESTNNLIATVASDGTVTAVAAGTCNIIANFNSEQESLSCAVTVNSKNPEISLSLNPNQLTLESGKSTTLEATVEPSDTPLKWKSSDSAIASVDQSGNVTAGSNITTTSTATITVSVESDSTKTATCSVTVTPKDETVYVESVSIISPNTTQSIKVGDRLLFTAEVQPANAYNREYTLRSSNSSVAAIENGYVVAKAEGTALITAVSVGLDGKNGSTISSQACTVNVSPKTVTTPITSISISSTSCALAVGGNAKLTASLQPTNTTEAVKWVSDNPSIASVAADGTVTGIAAGTTRIRATNQAGNIKSGDCTVVVTKLALSPGSLSLATGSRSAALTVTGVPSGATYTVAWKSDNTTFATVSSASGSSITVYGAAPGSTTITATVTLSANGASRASTHTLTCPVAVAGAKAADVTYATPVNTLVTLNPEHFNTACTGATGRPLDYISFSSLPSTAQGELYYNYRSGSSYDHKVSVGSNYRYNSSNYLSYVSFVPANNFTGTVTIPYVGQNNRSATFSGNLVITVGSASEVTYSINVDSPLTLDNNTFVNYCQDRTGYTFNFIRFTLPAASKGTLYYNYRSDRNYDNLVSSSTPYYRSSSPRLDNVTFVPASGYSGTVSINFTGESSNGNTFSGVLRITVGKGGDISYTTPLNAVVGFNDQDFIDYCQEKTGATLDYVTFSLPASSRGVLYHDYKNSGNVGTKVSSSTRYYRNSSPYLDDVTFVPATDYTGTVSISFTGYSTNGNSFSGNVKIYVGSDAGDVSYTTAMGTPLKLGTDKFNTYCKNVTGSNLDYVRFTLPAASSGVLYHNYTNSSSAGSSVSAATSYYRSSSPRLDDVTFVPAAGFHGTVNINFTGRSTGKESFSGVLVIKVTGSSTATAIYYTSTTMPVGFRVEDFDRALSGGSVQSVAFTLPSADQGKLYYNYRTPTSYDSLVAASTRYQRSASPSLASVSFVPKAGFSGTANISYSGIDANGNAYTGVIQIAVSPASTSQYFNDLGNYGWGVSSVDFLRQAGIVNGVGDGGYGPATPITRGDFVLMLYRAFNLSAATTEGFPDVPANSHYAQAIAVAKALGIAKGTDGKFNPTGTLTRQDAMLLIQRTIQVTGGSMADGAASILNSYPDGSAVADYARGAVAALLQAGVIKGDDSRRINPNGSITRVEMAVSLHRVLTL